MALLTFLYFMSRMRGTAISGLTYVRPFNHYYQIHNYCCTDSAPCTWNHWKGLCVSKFTTTHEWQRMLHCANIECERDSEEKTIQCYIFLQLFVFICCERVHFVSRCVAVDTTFCASVDLANWMQRPMSCAAGSIPFVGRRNCHLAYTTHTEMHFD